ncbi:MAG: peptidase, partial [Nitrosopumilus sp.]|nr:peptidase [Nitrosopumilus sp.]
MKHTLLLLILTLPTLLALDNVYGHGVGSETFPPVELDGRLVTLEVSSSKSDPNTNDDQQISISLIDFDSKITLRDVTFLIKSERGEQFLFEQEFKADNGFLVFNFVSEENNSIIIEENNEDNLFGLLLGLDSRMINVKGPKLSEGGLYKFDVTVLTADGYSKKLVEPLVFNAGISIAQTTQFHFVDTNFGEQNIQVISYYDEISNFQYDSDSKEIRFSMPFEWSQSNINQTSVVHEELVIPKSFGDLLVSGFSMYINGIKISQDVVNIDDFFSDERVVHFIIYQRELQNVFENNFNQDEMNFIIKPDRDYTHLSSVTENGQFRILVSWEPENLKSNSDAKIIFDITDIFLKNR